MKKERKGSMNILLAGDSTVTEQPRLPGFDPKTTYCGWGQMLPYFLQECTQVLNFADSGLTVETFRANGYYERLCAALAPKDFVLIQFGHNDQKLPHLRAEGGYAQGLTQHVQELRAMGAVPVLVTSVARNTWRGDDGTYNDLLAPYAKAVHAVGEHLDAPVLDLHAATVMWIQGMGLEMAKAYFHPGDYTHPNDFGGFAWAKMLAQCIAQSGHPLLEPLRGALLAQSTWPSMELEAQGESGNGGWCAPPESKLEIGLWQSQAPLTAAQGLIMVQTLFSYFVSQEIMAEPPLAALAAAQENGYLPKAYPCHPQALAQPVQAAMFAQLLQNACRGRNKMPVGAVGLQPETESDGTLSCVAAGRYAAAIEHLATGCVPQKPMAQAQAYRPAGS